VIYHLFAQRHEGRNNFHQKILQFLTEVPANTG